MNQEVLRVRLEAQWRQMPMLMSVGAIEYVVVVVVAPGCCGGNIRMERVLRT
jgi:hypothetical protein